MITNGRRGEVKLWLKLFAFLAMLITAVIVVMLPTLLFAGKAVEHPSLRIAILNLSMAVAVFLASWSCLAMFDGRSPAGLGLWNGKRTLINFLIGTWLGCGFVVVGWLIIVSVPSFEATSVANGPALSDLLILAFMMLFVAIGEEWLYRGYVFQLLARETMIGAMIIPGVLFVLCHGAGDGTFHLLPMLNLLLGHVWFGVAFLRTRDMGLPIGMHFGWNLMLGPVLFGRVSGKQLNETLFVTDYPASFWIGGAFGLEGGFLTTIFLFAGIGVVMLWPKRNPAWPDLALERSAAPIAMVEPAPVPPQPKHALDR
ncbi:MAG: lysostaphin resistance A-like protein [Phycisphaerae bacterium]